jgi:hypothetical protein
LKRFIPIVLSISFAITFFSGCSYNSADPAYLDSAGKESQRDVLLKNDLPSRTDTSVFPYSSEFAVSDNVVPSPQYQYSTAVDSSRDRPDSIRLRERHRVSPTPIVQVRVALPRRTGNALFDRLAKPLLDEAIKRRAERTVKDPNFPSRIDGSLNEGRINFLLFGYGETHEPPLTERAIIGSFTVISYDTRTGFVYIISLTHDIRAPEVERRLFPNRQPVAVRMDQAYTTGGFELMEEMLEDATGLSMDFQASFRDDAIQRLVDGVFQGIDVDVPVAFRVMPFYLQGVKYDFGEFKAGRQRLGGTQVIQFIKTVPIENGVPSKLLEHNSRKHLILRSMTDSMKSHSLDPGFWVRMIGFVNGEVRTSAIAYDFDPVTILVNNFGSTLGSIGSYANSHDLGVPEVRRSIYIVDPAHGDGGVQWINANTLVNPITKSDRDKGVYPGLDMEVPLRANPYGDLVRDYWGSVRTLVKKTLTE